jgi:hypothetical protein
MNENEATLSRKRSSMRKMILFESSVRNEKRNKSFVMRKSDDFENTTSPRIPFLTNDLYLLDIPSKKWCKVETSGKVPSEVEYHNSVIHEDFMYTFGGSHTFLLIP